MIAPLNHATREAFATTGKTGPEDGGIRYCVGCQAQIQAGEHWLKVRAADGSFAVGLHDLCYVRTAGGERRGTSYLCPVCGFLSPEQQVAVTHMKEVHAIADPQAAARLLK